MNATLVDCQHADSLIYPSVDIVLDTKSSMTDLVLTYSRLYLGSQTGRTDFRLNQEWLAHLALKRAFKSDVIDLVGRLFTRLT